MNIIKHPVRILLKDSHYNTTWLEILDRLSHRLILEDVCSHASNVHVQLYIHACIHVHVHLKSMKIESLKNFPLYSTLLSSN